MIGIGPGEIDVELDVNGERRVLRVEPRTMLAEALRDGCGLTGTKVACGRGACGACTVLLDGAPVASCLVFALDAVGCRITTIEGVAPGPDQLSPLQAAFVARDALQCGFCTPGMVMSCHALLARHPSPSEDDVREAVSGNLCRCGTYPRVVEAVIAAATGEAVLPIGAAPPRAEEAERPSELAVGVAGSLSRRPRAVPDQDLPPWDGEASLAVVGARVPRLDGPDKVTGRAQYASDVKLPGMLHAAVVRSPHPHARVRSIDFSAAERVEGVQATYALERILGPAVPRKKAKGPGRYPLVRFEGQPVAAVAATTPALAEEAARLVRVDYEPLPHVSDIDRAREPDAPPVFTEPVEQPETAGGMGAPEGLPLEGNVRGPSVYERPEGAYVENALRESAVVHEAVYRTQVQTHSALEPHGAVADWRPDGLTVFASTQGIFTVREELAALFKLPKSKVRVHCEFCGGGFGAKFGAGNHGVIAAELSRRARAPVRLFLDRRAEHLAVGNRPSSIQRLRIGASRDGALAALHLQAAGSAGCAAGAGCAEPAQNLYPCPVVRTEEEDVFIHAGPASAFRAPGHPQGVFALEQAMDELAERLGLDPLALRDRNDPHPARREERRIGADQIGWTAARARKPGEGKGPVKRGVGFAQGLWYNFSGPPASADVVIHGDGGVECVSGVQDIGGGIRTVIAQVVAEELGLAPGEVRVRIGDTAFPQGPASGGSMTTQLIAPAVRIAAVRAREALFAEVRGERDLRAAAKKLKGEVRGHGERLRDYRGYGEGAEAYNRYVGGAQFAEVAVDVETGVVSVVRIVAVHDCGRPVNRLTVESQICGGVLQGVSYALFEERRLDRHAGRMVNANLEQYRIAGSKDTPRIEPVIIDFFPGRSNVDASGIGEPATVPTAAAVANAVYHAIGVRLRELPITPARVLDALRRSA